MPAPFTWDDLLRSDTFAKLSPEQRGAARDSYFEEFVRPEVPKELDFEDVRLSFYKKASIEPPGMVSKAFDWGLEKAKKIGSYAPVVSPAGADQLTIGEQEATTDAARMGPVQTSLPMAKPANVQPDQDQVNVGGSAGLAMTESGTPPDQLKSTKEYIASGSALHDAADVARFSTAAVGKGATLLGWDIYTLGKIVAAAPIAAAGVILPDALGGEKAWSFARDMATQRNAVDDYINSAMEGWTSVMPGKWRDTDKKEWITKDGGLGPAWSDPLAYESVVLQSMPETLATMLPGVVLAKAAKLALVAKGIAPAEAALQASKTAAWSGRILEGLTGGAQSLRETSEQVNAMPEDVLAQSEAYRNLRAQGYSAERAKLALSGNIAAQAFVLGGVATGIFGGNGDKAIAKIYLGANKGGLVRKILTGAFAEALAEEFPQNYLQQVAQNFALQTANPNQDLFEGALNQAVGGAVAGGLMGGGFGGAAHVASRSPGATRGPMSDYQIAEAAAARGSFLTLAQSGSPVTREKAPDGSIIESPAQPARELTPQETGELVFLKANRDNPEAIAAYYGIERTPTASEVALTGDVDADLAAINAAPVTGETGALPGDETLDFLHAAAASAAPEITPAVAPAAEIAAVPATPAAPASAAPAPVVAVEPAKEAAKPAAPAPAQVAPAPSGAPTPTPAPKPAATPKKVAGIVRVLPSRGRSYEFDSATGQISGQDARFLTAETRRQMIDERDRMLEQHPEFTVTASLDGDNVLLNYKAKGGRATVATYPAESTPSQGAYPFTFGKAGEFNVGPKINDVLDTGGKRIATVANTTPPVSQQPTEVAGAKNEYKDLAKTNVDRFVSYTDEQGNQRKAKETRNARQALQELDTRVASLQDLLSHITPEEIVRCLR
jgi:hypothetical protein